LNAFGHAVPAIIGGAAHLQTAVAPPRVIRLLHDPSLALKCLFAAAKLYCLVF
jgi:hypothetical protein